MLGFVLNRRTELLNHSITLAFFLSNTRIGRKNLTIPHQPGIFSYSRESSKMPSQQSFKQKLIAYMNGGKSMKRWEFYALILFIILLNVAIEKWGGVH
jgi:hypothetical protein